MATVTINPGDNYATLTSGASAGDTIVWKKGVHLIDSGAATVKANQIWEIEFGAYITGAPVVTGWVADGGNFSVSYTQSVSTVSASRQSAGVDATNSPQTKYRIAVLVDDVWQTHVKDLASLVAGTFFYDEANQKVYLRDDPGNAVVRVARYDRFINNTSGVDGVTIRGEGIVTGFTNDAQEGAIEFDNGGTNNPDNLVVEGITIRHCYGVGLRIGGESLTNQADNIHIRNVKMIKNGQLGNNLNYVSNVVMEGCVLSGNNKAGFRQNWEAGGCKWARVDYGYMWDNVVADNIGVGLWADIDNRHIDYAFNIIHDNTRPGIFHEISYDATIRHNKLWRNTTNSPFELEDGNIFVYGSQDVTIEHNRIVTDANNIAGGIVLKQAARGTSYRSDVSNTSWLLDNITVRHNEMWLTQSVENRLNGWRCYGSCASFASRISEWDNNTYHINSALNDTSASDSDIFGDYDGAGQRTLDFVGWQAQGWDANGSIDNDMSGQPSVPNWAPIYPRIVHRYNGRGIALPGGFAVDTGVVDTTSDIINITPSDYVESADSIFPRRVYNNVRRGVAGSPQRQYWTFTGLEVGTIYDVIIAAINPFVNAGNRKWNVFLDTGSTQLNSTVIDPSDPAKDVGRMYQVSFTATATSHDIGFERDDPLDDDPAIAAIVIQEANSAPVVTAPPLQEHTEGDAVNLQIEAYDVDAGDTLTYSASNLPAGLSINSSTGVITGTVDGNAAASSPYEVTVTVTDDGSPNKSTSVLFDWRINASAAQTVSPSHISATGGTHALTLEPGAITASIEYVDSSAASHNLTLVPGNISIPLSHVDSAGQAHDLSLEPGVITAEIDHVPADSNAYAVTLDASLNAALSHIPATGQAYALSVAPGAATLDIPHISSASSAYNLTAVGEGFVAFEHIPASSEAYALTLTPGALTLDIPHIAPESQSYKPRVYDPALIGDTLVLPVYEFIGVFFDMPFFQTSESLAVTLDADNGAQSLSELGFTMTGVAAVHITVNNEDIIYMTDGNDPVAQPPESAVGHYIRVGREAIITGETDCANLKLMPVARSARLTITTRTEVV